MKKLSVAKGTVERQENLRVDELKVNGHLIVEGALYAKHICGKGTVQAGKIIVQTAKLDIIDADTVCARKIIANKVFCINATASEGIIAKDYIEAHTVRTEHLICAISRIEQAIANKIIQIPMGKRSFLGAIFSSWLREKFTLWEYSRIPKKDAKKADKAKKAKDAGDATIDKMLQEYKDKLSTGSYRLVLEPVMDDTRSTDIA